MEYYTAVRKTEIMELVLGEQTQDTCAITQKVRLRMTFLMWDLGPQSTGLVSEQYTH